MLDFDLDSCELIASKHFKNKYMNKWNWDYTDLRRALKEANAIKVGKEKYEAFLKWKGGKKIIFVHYNFEKQVFVISGSEGE